MQLLSNWSWIFIHKYICSETSNQSELREWACPYMYKGTFQSFIKQLSSFWDFSFCFTQLVIQLSIDFTNLPNFTLHCKQNSWILKTGNATASKRGFVPTQPKPLLQHLQTRSWQGRAYRCSIDLCWKSWELRQWKKPCPSLSRIRRPPPRHLILRHQQPSFPRSILKSSPSNLENSELIVNFLLRWQTCQDLRPIFICTIALTKTFKML